MSFDVVKVYKNAMGDQVGMFVRLSDGRMIKISKHQFVGFFNRFQCRNAVLVSANSVYVRGKGVSLPFEIIKEENIKPITQKPHVVEQRFIRPWEMDMSFVFADVLATISKLPIREHLCVRGGVALSLFLANKPDIARMTIDMDFDFRRWSEWENFVSHCADVLTKGSKAGYTYKVLNRKYNANTNGTDVLEVSCDFGADTPVKFHIDMAVRGIDSALLTKSGLQVASVYSMLCDKLSVLATDSILGRVKDLYDVYAFSFLSGIYMQQLLDVWNKEYQNINLNNIYTFDAGNDGGIQKVYERMNRLTTKADFQVVLKRACLFSTEFYLYAKNKAVESSLVWNEELELWE